MGETMDERVELSRDGMEVLLELVAFVARPALGVAEKDEAWRELALRLTSPVSPAAA